MQAYFFLFETETKFKVIEFNLYGIYYLIKLLEVKLFLLVIFMGIDYHALTA